MKKKIIFKPGLITVDVDEGKTRFDAAVIAGIKFNSSCGGLGICGKCRVLIEEGEVEVSDQIELKEAKQGIRLACKSIIKSDCIVRTNSSNIGLSELQGFSEGEQKGKKFSFFDLLGILCFDPVVKKKLFRLLFLLPVIILMIIAEFTVL
ncbi:MAG: 2Fe-2S iron-sulfur cluster binding domain-containing protein [Pseudomonadota bacterium]